MLPSEVRLRASVFYLGSALFLGTGVVSIADQPFGHPPGNGPHVYAGCDGPGDEDLTCFSNDVVCTDSNNRTCLHCYCYVTPNQEDGGCAPP